MSQKKIPGISGSLSESSANYSILKQITSIMGSEINFSIYNGTGQLPHFNPSKDIQPAHPELKNSAMNYNQQML